MSKRNIAINILFLFLNLIFVTEGVTKINVTNFQHLTTRDGLSQKSVRKIFQDSRGFMWFGTQEGLNRYDGKQFVVYRYSKKNLQSISNDVIRDIVEDETGKIWVATSLGLNLYEPNNQSFIKIELKNKQGGSVERLNTLLIDGNSLLIGTDGDGVITIDIEQKIQVLGSKLKRFDDSDIRDLLKDSRGRFWVATDGKGVWLSSEDNQFLQFDSSQNKLSHNRVRSIAEDHKGQIWVGTRGGGLNRFNELTKEFFNYSLEVQNLSSISNNRIYSILEDSKNNLWIGTDSGINLYQPKTDNFKRVESLDSQKYGLSHNRVLDIYEDEGGIVWVGTLAGLNLWDPITSKFAHFNNISERENSLSNNTVSGFAEGVNGNIFISSFGGGIDYLDESTQEIVRLLSRSDEQNLHDLRLTTLLYDSKNRLWVGSATKGVRVFDKEFKPIANYKNNKKESHSLSANGITDIFEDRDGEIWIGTYGAGLNRFISQSDTFVNYRHMEKKGNTSFSSDKISSDNIYQIFEDDEGYIWLATDGGGLSRLDKTTNEFVVFKNEPGIPNSLSSDTAWSILQDSKGIFWVGTQGNGLNRWEPEDRRLKVNKFKHYSIDNGMNSSTVNGMVEDDEGYIWISTNKGISRLNPNTDEFKHYNLSEELHHNEFIQGAILRDSSGRIFLGGENGITAFYPNEITENKHIPKVQLTNVFSENKKVNFNQNNEAGVDVHFNHKDYFVSFEFSALDFSQPRKNKYEYKLLGFDPAWIKIGNLNRATYTNLPSGNFNFLVRASNNDGKWSQPSINAKVYVKPAPWFSWWAMVIYATLFGFLLILFVHLQAKRIANQEYFKKKIIKDIDRGKQILEEENQELRKEMHSYQESLAHDMDSGLFNQKFFIEQLILTLDSLKVISEKQSVDIKLNCMVISLGNIEIKKSLLDELISSLALTIEEILPANPLIARWDTNQIAILTYSKLTENSLNKIKSVCEHKITELCQTSESIKISIGFTMNPLRQGDKNSFNWESIMKLTEHALKDSEAMKNDWFLGVVECHQDLNSTFISTVMVKTLAHSQDVFKLMGGDRN